MKQGEFKLSPVAIAVFGVMGGLGALLAHAEEAKELATVNVSSGRDTRTTPPGHSGQHRLSPGNNNQGNSSQY